MRYKNNVRKLLINLSEEVIMATEIREEGISWKGAWGIGYLCFFGGMALGAYLASRAAEESEAPKKRQPKQKTTTGQKEGVA